MKLLKCPICGNVVELVEDHGVPLMCSGKKMEEIKAGGVDAATEKYGFPAGYPGNVAWRQQALWVGCG